MSIKVSVVVPIHNTGKTVLDGLASFRAQSLPRQEFEVIYVDDGSTDDTPSLLASETAADENVRVIRIENSGWPGKPRNVGIDAARGAYIQFVDDDDWLAPEALERLYERAVGTGAEIVCGRMAGHGRAVARVLYNTPMAAGNVRRNTVLLSTMTVHKLFRRDFLLAHDLRFPEGKVRLEDHLFMLRAYLLAEKVATVHDYTCYHWVRHDDGKHNISFQRIDPAAYISSVRKLIGIIDEHLEPGPLRDKFISHWYASKALERLQGEKYLARPAGYRTELFEAVRSLVADLVPPGVDAKLPARQRVASALVRHGDRALLEEYAAFESGTTHEPRLDGLEWRGGELAVRISTQLVRPSPHGPGAPVLFSRADGRYRWQLPPAVAAAPGVAEAADFTDEVPRGKVTGLLRHREEATEIFVPTTQRVVDFPAADTSAGGSNGAGADRRSSLLGRLSGRLQGRGLRASVALADEVEDEPGAAGGAQLYGVRFESEFTVAPGSADQGRALHGVWDAFVRLDCCGWTSGRRLGALRGSGVDRQRMPAFFAGRGTGEQAGAGAGAAEGGGAAERRDAAEGGGPGDPSFINPYWTKPHANLSLSVDGSFDPLNRAVRDVSRIVLTGGDGKAAADGDLSVEIPLTIAPLSGPVPVTVRLERAGAVLLRIDAAIAPPADSGIPALTFRTARGPLAAACGAEPAALHIERGDRSGALGLLLHQHPATGQWSVYR
ncbi:glycosyltransferase family 2 protein [Streptomyces sp. H27-D2]|uniref:glycosyltransferase family 2 protein n=1 Tax=Streptomyces sp. H27-D2 TaxID=3046304 RepID=UPI002DB80A21|nr:glycosyltransferase family 2 protein [Streptomyces sp. H27-D2]MEC4019636.1 glycosyltransferase family 2 protein [Streptomyces sp. H27-D2]